MMPNKNEIKKAMKQLKISPEIISQINFDYEPNDYHSEPLFDIFSKMDKLLAEEQRLAVMERQGCHKTGILQKLYKNFGNEHAGKSLEEKLQIMSKTPDLRTPVLNNDGTLSTNDIDFFIDENGISHHPPCPPVVRSKPQYISPTYSGCCAGHIKYHWQNALGIKLKLIAINECQQKNGKGYSFSFEIVG